MTTTTRAVARTTWDAAAARAATAPDHRLPCPGCATSLRGADLTAHAHRAHLSGPAAMAAGHPIHVGSDRRLRRTAGWLAALALAALAGLAAATSTPVPVLLGGLAVLAAVVAGRGDRSRARLAVTSREVVLRHRAGTGIRRVALPARPESGALAAGAGSYLRVGHGRHAVTVGCPHGTGEREHWDGWTPGPDRRRWDVTLDPAEFVAFQYALAAAGGLVARGPA